MPKEMNYQRLHELDTLARGYSSARVLSLYLHSCGCFARIRFVASGNGKVMFVLRDLMSIILPYTVTEDGFRLGGKLRASIRAICQTPTIPKTAIYSNYGSATKMNAVDFGVMTEIIRRFGVCPAAVELRQIMMSGELLRAVQKVLPLGVDYELTGEMMRLVDCPLHRSVLMQRLAIPAAWDCASVGLSGLSVVGTLGGDTKTEDFGDNAKFGMMREPDYAQDSTYVQSLEALSSWTISDQWGRNKKQAEATELDPGVVAVPFADNSRATLRFGIQNRRLYISLLDLTLTLHCYLAPQEAKTALIPWVRRVCDGEVPQVAQFGKPENVMSMVPYTKLGEFLGFSHLPRAHELRYLATSYRLAAYISMRVPTDVEVNISPDKPLLALRKTLGEIESLAVPVRSMHVEDALGKLKAQQEQDKARARAYKFKSPKTSAADVWAQACAQYGLGTTSGE